MARYSAFKQPKNRRLVSGGDRRFVTLVDAFRYIQPWVKAYFLSHAHADHYAGLTENWSAGPVYCSPITAALAPVLTGVSPAFLQPLPLDSPQCIDGVQVTLVDANHCPGAVQFLFELPDGQCYIHCGDMRYCRAMQQNQQLARFRGADAVFLDTTYCRPRYTFPPQEKVVEFVASVIHKLLQEDAAAAADSDGEANGIAIPAAASGEQQQQQAQLPGFYSEELVVPPPEGQQEEEQQQQQVVTRRRFRRLYLISTYVIGKERLLLAVAARTGCRLLVTRKKLQVLRCVGLTKEQVSATFTTNPAESPIHVVPWGTLGDSWPYFRPNYVNMEAAREQAGAEEVVGIVPTGWMWEMRKAAAKGEGFPMRYKGPCTIHLVPYSEHSSYVELREYVGWLRPKQVIPTVNVGEPGAAGDKHRSAILQHFRGLIDEKSNKAAFLARFTSAGSSPVLTEFESALAKGMSAGSADTPAGNELCKQTAGGATAAAAAAVDDADTPAGAMSVEEFSKLCDATLGTELMTKQGSEGPERLAACSSTQAVRSLADAPTGCGGEDNNDSSSDCLDNKMQLLMAVAGPGSQLTSAVAAQILRAASGDVNAAMNAFLDSQRHSQNVSSGGSEPNGSANSNKGRQQQQEKGLGSPEGRRGIKKPKRQAGPAIGRGAITSFFSQKVPVQQLQQQKPKPAGQQKQQVDGPLQQQQQQQHGTGAGLGSKLAVVLPPLKGRLSRSLSGPGVARGSVAPSVASAQLVAESSTPLASVSPASKPPPAAAAVVPQAASMEREFNAAKTAIKAIATPQQEQQHQGLQQAPRQVEEDVQPVQQQQQHHQQAAVTAAKRSWAALLPGNTQQASKRHKANSNSTPPRAVAHGISDVATSPTGQQGQQIKLGIAHATMAADGMLAPPAADTPDKPVADPAASATASSATVIGAVSGGSGSGVVTKAMREAPLLPVTRYNPLSHACWLPGEPAPYLAIGLTLAAIDGTASRLLIADGLTNMFRSIMLLSPADLTAAAYLTSGRIAPEYAGIDLNIGGGVVSAALREVCGVSRAQMRDMYSNMGDLGDVAQACRHKQSSLLPPPPLTITGVFSTLHTLAGQSGQGAAGRRQAAVARLLRSCRDVETKYLVRTLISNLRVGASWKSILGPLAKAALLHRKMVHETAAAAGTVAQAGKQTDSAQAVVQVTGATTDAAGLALTVAHVASYAASSASRVTKKQLGAAAAAAAAAYHTCPNLSVIVKILMEGGPEALATRVQLTCGVPVKPMLAKMCTGVAEAFAQLAVTVAAGEDAGTAVAGVAAAAAAATISADASAAADGVESDGDDEPAELPVEGIDVDAGVDDGEGPAGLDADLQQAAFASPAETIAGLGVVVDPAAVDDLEKAADLIAHQSTTQNFAAEPSAASIAASAAAKVRGRQAGSRNRISSSTFAVLAEFKYDGQRAQIHIAEGRQVQIFSRNCEDRTGSFPDVVSAMLAAVDPTQLPLVVDAELAAVDRADGNRVRAFQELATRPRPAAAPLASAGSAALAAGVPQSPSAKGVASSAPKQQRQAKQQTLGTPAGPANRQQSGPLQQSTNVAKAVDQALDDLGDHALQQQQQQLLSHPSGSSVDVCVFLFDALLVAGHDLMGCSFRDRRAALAAALPRLTPGVVQMAEGVEITVTPAAAAAAMAATAAGTQGAIIEAPAVTSKAEVAAVTSSALEAPAAHDPEVTATLNEHQAAAAVQPSSAASTLTVSTAVAAAGQQLCGAEQLVTEFFFSALAAGSEGLMMKLLDGPGSVYQPAKRGLSWLKLKRDYLEGLADSLDLVPIGAWQGQGRKVKWFSPFLLAVYDPATESFQSLCRCMSGFTDEFYAAATERLAATVIPGPKPYYQTLERPDVWFEPTEVWELRGADISISPMHRAAAGRLHPDRGLGLRFPRFLRLRPDKRPEEASGPSLVVELYNRQTRRVMQHD